MINVDVVNMYCSKCTKQKHGFRSICRDNVVIIIDLEKDEFIFTSVCPVCDQQITNTRSAFGR